MICCLESFKIQQYVVIRKCLRKPTSRCLLLFTVYQILCFPIAAHLNTVYIRDELMTLCGVVKRTSLDSLVAIQRSLIPS